MSKIIIYSIFIIALILNTFFGLGPVIYADGSMSERILTLAIVLFIYFILGGSLMLLIKRNKKHSKGNK
jgi:hypothetical protein